MDDGEVSVSWRLGYYEPLLRLEQRGWISSRWGASDKNRRAKFYELNGAGRKQIARETNNRERTVALMQRFLRVAE